MGAPLKKTYSYKCELCNRDFKEASHFSKHKRGALCLKIAQKLAKKNKQGKECFDKKGVVHSATFKPYQCNLCGAKFFDRVNVELHLERTHQTQQPLWVEVAKSSGFACSECDLWFADKIQLKHHQLQHTSMPQVSINESLQHGNIPQQSIIHNQYYPQPLSHMAPNFSSNPLHHTSYSQLAPINSTFPPPSQPIYQILHQHQTSTNGHSHSSMLITPSSNDNNPISSLPQLSGSICYQSFSNSHINNQVTNTVLTNSNSSGKQNKFLKIDRGTSSSRWNICGDCGHKFVDPINLELHMQRKHPNSIIIETIAISGSLMLYKTNNSKNVDDLSPETVIKIQTDKNKLYECDICNFKCELLSNMSNHYQESHNKNADIMQNTLEVPVIKDQRPLKCSKQNTNEMVSKSIKQKCDACNKIFSSKAELIRHRVKDKNIMCGVCSFSSCNNMQVAMHMYSCHKESDNGSELISSKINEFCEQGNCILPSNIVSANQGHEIPVLSNHTSNLLSKSVSIDKDLQPSRLSCCMCNFYATSGVSLAQHLESHGSIHVKCGKCGESNSSFIEINNHINTSHSCEVVRVTLTMKASHTPSVYMFLITPKSLDFVNTNNLTSEKVTINNSDDKVSGFGEASIYACSVCGASLTGQYQLEAHLLFHQNSSGSVCSNDSINISSNYHSDNISCQSPLLHTQNTVEFRCQECGFWREQSDSVIKHIQSVHMSAKMIHSQRQTSGRIVGQTIHVFTPLSAMVSN